MPHTLRIQLKDCEGAVLRALGLIERRSYRLSHCVIEEADGGERTMQVSVSSTRPVDLLQRQLERLHDVVSVKLQAAVIFPHNPDVQPLGRRT